MANGESSWLTEYIGLALAGVGTVATGAAGLLHKRYTEDRKRLFTLQARLDKLDMRVGTMAEAMETIVERQDKDEVELHAQRELLVEIKTNVEWIKRELEVAGYQRRRQQ